MDWAAAIIGLGGAVIGATSTAVVAYIAQRQETKRKLQAELLQIGFKHWEKLVDLSYKGHIDFAPKTPLAHIMAFTELFRLIDRLPNLSEADLQKILSEYHTKIERLGNFSKVAPPASNRINIGGSRETGVNTWHP